MLSYPDITCAASEYVLEAGKFINDQLNRFSSSDIITKDRNSLVSYVDKEAERILVKGLSKVLPEALFITEEDTVANNMDAELTWIIDPLDGTSNFLHHIPHFAVSVGLKQGDQIVCGLVLSVVSGELFTASLGHGAYLNDKLIQVSQTDKVENAVIATGFPYQVKDEQPLMNTLSELMLRARGIRRFGAAALDLAFVAAGRFDAYYETSLNAWDVAAGVLLITEAGGQVADFRNGPDYLFGGNIAATNGRIHEELMQIIQANFI
jgi:myo-inositol-1(or 4)-monophosphatase